MVRSRSTTPAYKADSCRHELACVARHILGRTKIDISALYGAWHAGVRLSRQGKGGQSAYALHGVQHGNRANAAIAAYYIGTPLLQARRERFGSRAVEAYAVLVDGHLRHNR